MAASWCHQLKGIGGTKGADLTGITRMLSRKVLLKFILNPKVYRGTSKMRKYKTLPREEQGFQTANAQVAAIVRYLENSDVGITQPSSPESQNP